MLSDRIAITGYGSVSPSGGDPKRCWNSYFLPRHALVELEFNNKKYMSGAIHPLVESEICILIRNFPRLKRLDRTALLAILASDRAMKSIVQDEGKDFKTLVNIGSSRGATGIWEHFHEAYLSDKQAKTALLTSPLTTLGNISSEVASFMSINSFAIDSSSTCSTALQAIMNGVAWLRAGMADRILAGGSEAPLTPFTFAQIEALGIYSKDRDHAFPCRPLYADFKPENTFVLGEAASVVVLEKLSKSNNPLAVINSFGYAFQSPPSATGISEDGDVIYRAMKMAVDSMETSADIDLVLMHAPGTVKGDQAELTAIKTLFPVNLPFCFSGKWKTGHCYAASAGLNTELAIQCLQHNDYPEFPYKNLLHQKKKSGIKNIMINATGFGGNAVSIILSRPSLF
jgi:3-oxoacyl-[acyl-carrier-protein] synthase II